MSEHGEWQLASPKRRAAARAVDAAVTVVLAFVAVMVLGITAGIVSLSVDGFGNDSDTIRCVVYSVVAVGVGSGGPLRGRLNGSAGPDLRKGLGGDLGGPIRGSGRARWGIAGSVTCNRAFCAGWFPMVVDC